MKNSVALRRVTGFLVLLAGIVGPCGVLAKNNELEESLKAKYELAKTGIGRLRITKTGTVLVIQKDGIYASPSGDTVLVANKIVGGELVQKGGLLGSFAEKGNNRTLTAGETVYATRIEVRRNEVKFDLITCDDYQVNFRGSSRQIRYAATIAFQFPEGFLETAGVEAVKKAIDPILLPQAEAQSVKTKTVKLGQAPEEVEAILGKPERVVDLGQKKIYVYKDMKIIFMDGKVADVE